MCRKPSTAFEWAHFFVTFLLRNKKVNKRSFKETCFFASFFCVSKERSAFLFVIFFGQIKKMTKVFSLFSKTEKFKNNFAYFFKKY